MLKLTFSSYEMEIYMPGLMAKIGPESCLYPVPLLNDPEQGSQTTPQFPHHDNGGRGQLPDVDRYSAS